MNEMLTNHEVNIQNIKKFYFIDYFYILLLSTSKNSFDNKIFQSFIDLKEEFNLGESKYPKIKQHINQQNKRQEAKNRYTFEQVLHETIQYNLITKIDISNYKLTQKGESLLDKYKNDRIEFNKILFESIEKNSKVFYNLLNLLYGEHLKFKNQLMILPIYSPLKLGFEKKHITKTKHIFEYSSKLKIQIEKDVNEFLHKKVDLINGEIDLVNKLQKDGLIGKGPDDFFDLKQFDITIKRIRDFWLNYLLKNVYELSYSYSTFNIIIERGKHLGILHTTEFYPNVNGRIVYPTSVITSSNSNKDFTLFYEYEKNRKLYLHNPKWENEKNQEKFVDALYSSYIDIQKHCKTHFINLSDIREKVCFLLKIPSFVFDDFLEKTYFDNLKGKIKKIQISLEADKLPEETNAIYLKRMPVLVNNQFKNIIAINYR